MLGCAFISAVVAIASGVPSPLVSQPSEEMIACLPRDPPLPPSRGRLCIEMDGIAGPECRPHPPLPFAEHVPAPAVRVFARASANDWVAPAFVEAEPPERKGGPKDGHSRAPDEPPRTLC